MGGISNASRSSVGGRSSIYSDDETFTYDEGASVSTVDPSVSSPAGPGPRGDVPGLSLTGLHIRCESACRHPTSCGASEGRRFRS